MPEPAESDDEGVPTLSDTSDDEGADDSDDEPLAEAKAQPEAEARKPSAGAEAPPPGTDTRGLGLETFEEGERQEPPGSGKLIPTSRHLARRMGVENWHGQTKARSDSLL